MSAKAKAVAKPTRYEISAGIADTDLDDQPMVVWRAVATVEANGARAALRQYVDGLGDKFTGGPLRAVPVSNITQVEAKVETQRKLTLA